MASAREHGGLGAPAPSAPPAQGHLGKDRPLRQLGFYDVPYHADFGPEDRGGHVDLAGFLAGVFGEAAAWRIRGWKETGRKREGGIGGQVEVLQYRTARRDVWFGRWCEFVEGSGMPTYAELESVLRVGHSVSAWLG